MALLRLAVLLYCLRLAALYHFILHFTIYIIETLTLAPTNAAGKRGIYTSLTFMPAMRMQTQRVTNHTQNLWISLCINRV